MKQRVYNVLRWPLLVLVCWVGLEDTWRAYAGAWTIYGRARLILFAVAGPAFAIAWWRARARPMSPVPRDGQGVGP